MRMSQMFGQTLREAPADAEVISHQLLVRAGYIRQLGAGIYTLMPLGMRTTVKVEAILREEMNKIGGQEIFMPVIHPAELWKETGRWYKIGDEMSRFQDKHGRDMVLAMTHEEVVADLVRKDIQSYRQLPRLVYHLQTKWRNDPRPRAGLFRVREFTMKDSYTLDRDEAGLDTQYRAHYQAYFDIFHRCGLPVVAVGADVGMMGGSLAHEYMYLTPIGEDTLLLSKCGYKANRQIAGFQKPIPDPEDERALEKVATPEIATIEALAEFLDVPKSRTAKAVFMMGTFVEGQEESQKLVFAVVRGDMDLNETKLMNAVKAKDLRPAHEDEIAFVGAVPGYASPIGLERDQIILVVDDLIPNAPNLVAGANEAGYHLRNTNYSRDYEAHVVADIVSADEGFLCPRCGKPMQAQRGVEVGNIFKLGTDFTVPLGANYLDENGEEQPVVMGSYGIGSGRLVQSIVEEYNDEHGIIWPITVAPYHVHLVSLRGGEDASSHLYEELVASGLEVLFDDRDETPGVKFKDADLIGVPIRITVSKRSLQEGATEFKLRHEESRHSVALEEAVAQATAYKKMLESEIAKFVIDVPFED